MTSIKHHLKKLHPTYVRESFNNLTSATKLMLIGNIILIIAAFLPWWSSGSLDFANEQVQVNAFTGAAYLSGTVAFLQSLFLLVLEILRLADQEVPKDIYKIIPEKFMELFFGSIIFILIVTTMSVYSSPEFSFSTGFGDSMIKPGLGIGIYLSFIGSVVLLVGGWKRWRGLVVSL